MTPEPGLEGQNVAKIEQQPAISGVVVRHEDVEAHLAWLRDYSDKITKIMAGVERGSMQAAAHMTAVYEAREWVKDLPPVKVAHRRGQPIKGDSIDRFVQWVQEHHEQIGDVYSRSRINTLLGAQRLATEYLAGSAIYSADALGPLRRFTRDRQSELSDITRRVKEITDGGPVTETVVKRAIHDHQQSLIPAKVADAGRRTEVDHAANIRAEFRAILKSKRFRDAGKLLNELRAELMEAAGVSDDQG